MENNSYFLDKKLMENFKEYLFLIQIHLPLYEMLKKKFFRYYSQILKLLFNLAILLIYNNLRIILILIDNKTKNLVLIRLIKKIKI